MLVTRNARGATSLPPPTLDLSLSTSTRYASSDVTHFAMFSKPVASPSPVIRCRSLHRLNDLLPSMHERAKGIAQCYIVSLGIELLRRRGVSFHELIQSQVVSFNCF